MEHVQQLVDELTGVVQQPLFYSHNLTNDNANEPIYDCQQSSPQKQRWIWRPPSQLPPPVGPVDLGFMLKSIDYSLYQQNPELASHCHLISATLNRTRSMLQDSTEMLYTYLNLLRLLMPMFDNTNVKARSYFTCVSQPVPSFSNLMAEYLQVLLLLSMRLYTQTMEMQDGSEKAALLNECLAATQEVCDSADTVQSGRYEETRRQRRWQYIKPPKSLSPEQRNDPITRLEEFRQQDSRQLKEFVRHQLGGLSQLSAHLVLIQLQKNEMRARQLEQEVRRDLASQNVIVYSVLAPVIQSVLSDYADIMTRLQEKSPASRLMHYAESMILYWETRQQYLLAASDFAIYESGTHDNFIEYGKRAWRRLRGMTILSDTDKEAVQTLYDRVFTEMDDQSGNGSIMSLDMDPEIESFTMPDQQKRDFNHYAEYHWLRFRAQNNAVQQSLDVLASLYGDETNRSTTLIVTTADVSHGPILPAGSSMTNATKAAILYERLRHLQWLLSLTDAKEEILLSQTQVSELRDEQVRVEQVMQSNKMVY